MGDDLSATQAEILDVKYIFTACTVASSETNPSSIYTVKDRKCMRVMYCTLNKHIPWRQKNMLS